MKTLLPEINSADKRFHAGNPSTGEQGTRVTDTWLNDVQDRVRDTQNEVINVLSAAGMTPTPEVQNQLYLAILKLIEDSRRQATTTTKGEVMLTDDTGLDSDRLGLSARAGKKLAQWLAKVQLALSDYIPNAKKSDAVDSSSSDTVATSAAVKEANDNANGRVSKGGDVMSGDFGIKSGNYSGVNLFNLADARVRLESLEHENSAFFSKLSYILGSDSLNSILFPKSGINQVVAYQDWVNAVIAGLIKRYNGAGHAWYGQHYLGCDVYRIPFSDSAGLKIQLLKGDWWDGNWITTPESFDGYWFALGVDIGGGRDSIGFTLKDRNMMQIHTDHRTLAHILAIGWYSY